MQHAQKLKNSASTALVTELSAGEDIVLIFQLVALYVFMQEKTWLLLDIDE